MSFSLRAFDEKNVFWYRVEVLVISPGITNHIREVDVLRNDSEAARESVVEMLGDGGVVTKVTMMGRLEDYEREIGMEVPWEGDYEI